jgi:hypothetical protein
MKKNTIFGIIGMMVLAFLLIGTPASFACSGPLCYETSGEFSRDTGASQEAGNVELRWVNVGTKNKPEWEEHSFLINGSWAYGGESSAGEYSGKAKCNGYVIGATGGLGLTTVGSYNDRNTASAYGITGNIHLAGITAYNGKNLKASVEGSGGMNTAAIKTLGNGVAAASTNGSFMYAGKTNGAGIVIGGGVTAGFSSSNVGGNTATAISGGITVSGAGGLSGGRGPQ